MFRDPFAVYVYTVEMIKLVGSRVPATNNIKFDFEILVVANSAVNKY